MTKWPDALMKLPECPKREGKPCCWHRSSYAYTSNPPQYDESCCWCGKVERIVVREMPHAELPEHGPHHRTPMRFG